MNVVYVISSLVFGGAEKQVIITANEMARKGHKVTLISLDNKIPRQDEVDKDNVDLIVLEKSKKGALITLFQLSFVLLRIKPDVVHSFLFDADIFTRVIKPFLGFKLFSSERNDDYVLSIKQKCLHVLTYRFVNGVIANSFAGAEFAKSMYNYRKETYVVWNGIDVGKVSKVAVDKAALKLELFGEENVNFAVMVASIKEQKNHILALDVAEEFLSKNPSWRFLFVGDKLEISDDQYKSGVMNHYNKLINKQKVYFCGRRSDVINILKASDLSFITSTHEGFPNAILEAMTAGSAVVSTEYSDIKKILPCPFQIRSADTADFTAGIEKVLENLESVVKLQYQWVVDNCSLNALTSSLEKIYQGK